MLDPALLRDNLEVVREGLRRRGVDLTSELEELAALESRRRRLLPELEGLKREQNAAGDEVARARRQGTDIAALLHRLALDTGKAPKGAVPSVLANANGIATMVRPSPDILVVQTNYGMPVIYGRCPPG